MADRPKTPSADYFERSMPYTAALKPIGQEVRHRTERDMLLAVIDSFNSMVFSQKEQGEQFADLTAHLIVADARQRDEQAARLEWQEGVEKKLKDTRNELRRVATKATGSTNLEDSSIHNLEAISRAERHRGRKVMSSFGTFFRRRASGRAIDIAVTFLMTAAASGIVYWIVKAVQAATHP